MISFIIKFIQCFFYWKVLPNSEEELGTAQAILSEAFGLCGDKPGKSNEALAACVLCLWHKLHLPLILTREVSDCLPDLPKAGVISQRDTNGKRRDAYRAIVKEVSICKKNGWVRAIIIAHPLHYWRCMMVARKLNLETLTASVPRIPYDKYSDQVWTRHPAFFIPYEIGARIFYLLTGKI
ncbi:MAG: hypothetical protein PHF35_02775 [Candidatus Moranbacteria bacterium]|nr:hypothetical protein [Candidatus Moranbacteria bacterium]